MKNQPDYKAKQSELQQSYESNTLTINEKQRFIEMTLPEGTDRERKLVRLKTAKVDNELAHSGFERYFSEINTALATGDITFETVTDGKFEEKVEAFKIELNRIATRLKP